MLGYFIKGYNVCFHDILSYPQTAYQVRLLVMSCFLLLYIQHLCFIEMFVSASRKLQCAIIYQSTPFLFPVNVVSFLPWGTILSVSHSHPRLDHVTAR